MAVWYTFEGKRRRYYPDLYLPFSNRIIEIKSTYTWNQGKTPEAQNAAKMMATKQLGYACEVWIMSPKGELEQVVKF